MHTLTDAVVVPLADVTVGFLSARVSFQQVTGAAGRTSVCGDRTPGASSRTSCFTRLCQHTATQTDLCKCSNWSDKKAPVHPPGLQPLLEQAVQVAPKAGLHAVRGSQ